VVLPDAFPEGFEKGSHSFVSTAGGRLMRWARAGAFGLVLLSLSARGAEAGEVANPETAGSLAQLFAAKKIVRVPFDALSGHTGPVAMVAISPDGKRAVSAGGWPRGDRTIRLWDLDAQKQIAKLGTLRDLPKQPKLGEMGPREQVGDSQALAWSPDGKQFAAGLSGGDLVVFDSNGGRPFMALRSRPMASRLQPAPATGS
jgi:WD40 repeat protein